MVTSLGGWVDAWWCEQPAGDARDSAGLGSRAALGRGDDDVGARGGGCGMGFRSWKSGSLEVWKLGGLEEGKWGFGCGGMHVYLCA